MIIVYSKQFVKMARKLSPKLRAQLADRMELFATDPAHPQLRRHVLHTPYGGSFSIDITGDYRAIYQQLDDTTALFTHVGTHSQLYR